MKRPLAWLVAATSVATLSVVSAGAPPAAADNFGVDLVVPSLASMLPGQHGWVSVLWLAQHDVCNVRVTATGPGLTIGYPTNTSTYSSLYTSNGLAKTNMDYTALDVAVGATVTSSVTVSLTMTWQALPANVINKNDDLKTTHFVCSGTAGTQTYTATLPVVPSTGAAVVQKTTAVAVPRSTPAWVNLVFSGTKPNLNNFRVALTAPTGLTVGYPGSGTSAGLNAGTTLPVGQDDFVAVRLDTSGMAAGTYQVPVTATYTGGTYTGHLTLTVT